MACRNLNSRYTFSFRGPRLIANVHSKQVQSLTEVVPECILGLLPLCTGLEALECIDLAAVVATPKLLQPLKGHLTSLRLDPAGNANMCTRPMLIGPEPHALFADWAALKHLNISRRSFAVYDAKMPFACQLESVSLTQCVVSQTFTASTRTHSEVLQIEGKMARIFENSAATLTVLELQAVGGVVMHDLLQVLEHCGPSLSKLVLRSCRYVRVLWNWTKHRQLMRSVEQMNDFTDRSFDAIFARCNNLEHLNLDLSLVPVQNPSVFLAHQPKLTVLELKRHDWGSFDDWVHLFGANSKSIQKVTVLGAHWSSKSVFAGLKERLNTERCTVNWPGWRTFGEEEAFRPLTLSLDRGRMTTLDSLQGKEPSGNWAGAEQDQKGVHLKALPSSSFLCRAVIVPASIS